METKDTRTELLIGVESLEKLSKATVLVLGLGGVGGFACESLARSGIGKLIIVDNDTVNITNLNRQIIATKATIGKLKTEVMKERIELVSDTKVEIINTFVDESFKIPKCDYIVDCIDTLTSKFYVQKQSSNLSIPCISSLGMANRLDPSKIVVTTLDKTSYDPLARSFRNLVKKEHYNNKIKVVLSTEVPMKKTMYNEDGVTRKEKYILSSMIFVPAAAGLVLSSYVVKELIK
jgi:tRNA A37 threonylcarbamoyladenosine dehydratase